MNWQPHPTLWTYVDYLAYLTGEGWSAVRRIAVAHAGGVCAHCGLSRKLHVHHRTYANLGRETLRDVQVLCAECHAAAHESDPSLRSPRWQRAGWSLRLVRK